MRVFHVIALLGLMTVPAFSQGMAPTGNSMMPGFRLNEGREYTDEEKARMKANEEAAKAARSTLPNAKANTDPWAGARAAEAPVKATPKAVKPKAAAQ
jgi:hypothetical protein